ncbi:MAG: thioredoxin fold domain-containing protein [Nitrospinae bacterium]|nr:thioredoxin fold domain-containing protein [Nitrospinota bacterium]
MRRPPFSPFIAAVLLVFGAGAPSLAADPYSTGIFEPHFGVMQDELKAAAGNGKTLMIYFWQEGCPYCEKLEKNVLSSPKVRKIITESFRPVEVNIFGSREAVDFAGAAGEEKKFAEAQKALHTPTMVFYGKDGTEVFRLPGYWEEPHFLAALAYVRDGKYSKSSFQEFLRYEWFKPKE